MKYEVGQKLWLECSEHRRGPRGVEVEVTKIGRKWVELSLGYKVALGVQEVDGGNYSSPGRVWASRADADAHNAVVAEWRAFVNDPRVQYYRPPAGLTLEAIAQAREILGIKKSG